MENKLNEILTTILDTQIDVLKHRKESLEKHRIILTLLLIIFANSLICVLMIAFK